MKINIHACSDLSYMLYYENNKIRTMETVLKYRALTTLPLPYAMWKQLKCKRLTSEELEWKGGRRHSFSISATKEVKWGMEKKSFDLHLYI